MSFPYTERINRLPKWSFRRIAAVIEDALGGVFPAASLAVMHHGKMVLEAGWGWIDPVHKGHVVTADTRFDLASISKIFTATVILQQVHEGKVGLETPLVEIVPEFMGENGLRGIDGGQHPFTRRMLPVFARRPDQPVDVTRVTLRHLLTHTSGLAPWRALCFELGDAPLPGLDAVERAARWRDALKLLAGYPFVEQPGAVIRYSDLGFMLLGEAASRIDQRPLEQGIAERILAPLGLATTLYNPLLGGVPLDEIAPTEYDSTWRLRRCHGEVDDENAWSLGGVSGHAGLFAAARDIAAFGWAWLTRDPRLGLGEDVAAEAVRLQAHDETERRGLGWQLAGSRDDETASDTALPADSCGHTGFTGTALWIIPSRQVVIACLTNRVYYGRDPDGIGLFRARLHQAVMEALEAV